ncbi:hypothetical protein YC2023_109366 [Brassica napus]
MQPHHHLTSAKRWSCHELPEQLEPPADTLQSETTRPLASDANCPEFENRRRVQDVTLYKPSREELRKQSPQSVVHIGGPRSEKKELKKEKRKRGKESLRHRLEISGHRSKLERWKLRLKTIEDGLKGTNTFSICQTTTKTVKTGKILGFLTSGGGGSKKRSSSQPRRSVTGRIHAMNQPINSAAETDGKENSKISANGLSDHDAKEEDMVSGFLYDRLQKEPYRRKK